MKSKWISLMLVVTMLSTVPAMASTLTNKKNELNATKQNIEQKKQALKDTKEEKGTVIQQIKDIDANMMKVENELSKIESDLEKKEEQLTITEVELTKAIEKRDLQYEATKDRMVHMYKNSKVGYLEVLFSTDNFWEMLNRMQYVKAISYKDKELLGDYEEQKQYVETKKVTLEEEKASIEALHQGKTARKEQLETMRNDKDNMLSSLTKEEKELYASIEEMIQVSKDLEAQIKKLTQKSNIKYNGGKFAWPVPSNFRISSEYNPRTSPISGRYEFHSGIDIPAPYGKSVVAAADGVVINSGWIRGYGNSIMINHGSGIVSLYGHNSSLVVSQGQTVKKGQTVAKIGSTGNSTGNHCHFEVRVNGKHTNPWQYLNK